MEDCAVSSYYEKILATGEVKCIDEEVPFEIPQGWEWCRLGEISTYAQTKRKINASNADTQLWGLDLEDIEKGGRLLNIKTVGERKAIGDKTVFNRGDILYSKLRPYLLKILVAPEGGICTPEIIPFTCYGNICKDYIVSFLKSPYVDDYINSATFGVKMPRVSTETMTSLLVPLPPLSEQFRIDTKAKELMPYIDEYGKAQDKLNKLNEELSYTIRKSILQEAIQGKLVPQIAEEGTAQKLLEEIKAEKQKLVKEGKLKKSALNDSVIFRGDDNKYYEQVGKKCVDITEQIPFEIPNSWAWTRMGQIGDWGAGSTPQRSNPDYYGGNILWLKTGELNNGIVYESEEKITQKAFQDCSLRMNKKGDVLIAMYGATIGKLAIVGNELTTNQACCGCTPYMVYNWYLFYFLMASRDTFIKKGEHKLRISHSIMCLPGEDWSTLTEVNSHPVALAQCRDFLQHHPQLKVVETEDTAGSARDIKEKGLKGHAAICSKYAAELYGMKILQEGIETNKHNFTRFLVICDPWMADELKDRSKINKANIVFSLPHNEGSLSQVLSIFSFYHINLTKIQSLPIIGREWEYLFYVDVMFNDYLRYKQSIDAVMPLTKALKILGEYAEGESTL